MRLIRITTNYSAYLRQFYEDRPGLSEEPYAAQYRLLMADCFGTADFWTHALEKLGYTVWEPVGNAEPMQKAWARENGARYGEGSWLPDIAAAQVIRFRPDVLFVNDYVNYTHGFLRRVRDECSSVRLVIGRCGSPYSDESVFRAYDIVLSNVPGLVDDFRKKGHRCEYMLHAFEPSILERLDRHAAKAVGFSFVGSIVKEDAFHNARERLLKHLARETDLRIWADVRRPSPEFRRDLRNTQRKYHWVRRLVSLPGGRPLAAGVPKLRRYAEMPHPPEMPSCYVDDEVASRAEPPLFGLAMYRKLHESKMTLNTHIDISTRWASNMRLYEATGVGTCLLTERQKNLGEIFEPDTEVVTYGSPEEAVEKARYLLERDGEREKIARAGQRRTLKDHTYDRRARELDAIIVSSLARRGPC
jgi:spore maturation protein CgeB